MPAKMLKEYLENHHIQYTCASHSPAYTAQEVAAAAHVSGKQMAKIVIIKAGNKLAMVVLPAHDHINFEALKLATGEREINLASESSFKGQFPECEVGAMPPFGHLYHLPVYVSNLLSHQDQIIFNAGSHSEIMKMAYRDFERLEKPQLISA